MADAGDTSHHEQKRIQFLSSMVNYYVMRNQMIRLLAPALLFTAGRNCCCSPDPSECLLCFQLFLIEGLKNTLTKDADSSDLQKNKTLMALRPMYTSSSIGLVRSALGLRIGTHLSPNRVVDTITQTTRSVTGQLGRGDECW